MWNPIQSITVNISDSVALTRRYMMAVGIGIASGLFFYAIAGVIITFVMGLMNHVVK